MLVLVFIVAMMLDPQHVTQDAMARQHRDRRVRTPDEPQRLAIIECAICDAWVEVYRCRQGDEKSSIEWQIRDDAELCRHPPPHSCPQARLEVGRRFPDEVLS